MVSLAGQVVLVRTVVVGRTGWLFLAGKVVLPGKVFIGRTGCCLQDRLLLAGQVVVGMTSCCWQYMVVEVQGMGVKTT